MIFRITKALIFLLLVFILAYFIYTKDGDNIVKINLKNICRNAETSLYNIVFKDRNVTIYDKHNAIKYMLLDKDDLVNKFFTDCTAKHKVFNIRTSIILKTEKDSIDIEPTYEKVHGYMGVINKMKCYRVANDGGFVICKQNKRDKKGKK